jgi:hypothetical protein
VSCTSRLITPREIEGGADTALLPPVDHGHRDLAAPA